VKVDQRERTTRRERFGRDATIRASNCISAEELGALRDGGRGASDGSECAAPQSAVPAKPARRTVRRGRVFRPGIDCVTAEDVFEVVHAVKALPFCPREISDD
jgi:hypothetical protein